MTKKQLQKRICQLPPDLRPSESVADPEELRRQCGVSDREFAAAIKSFVQASVRKGKK
jgi:hypothetical protein